MKCVYRVYCVSYLSSLIAASSLCSACLKAATISVGVASSLKCCSSAPAPAPASASRPRRRAPPPASVRGDSASSRLYGQF